MILHLTEGAGDRIPRSCKRDDKCIKTGSPRLQAVPQPNTNEPRQYVALVLSRGIYLGNRGKLSLCQILLAYIVEVILLGVLIGLGLRSFFKRRN